ncbi:(Fe-S)-binding protein [Nocardioides speluncae]|uniref:(Fe-S)-binding protein n=1 Tax=Nocardioides speluncae TaxID=2670337 RepID=UPI000D68976E|nr:(Fe-S)-binding protein [Nocardioides speluncae]
MAPTLILGLGMTAVTLVLAGQRVRFLFRLISSGQPAPDRIEGVTKRTGTAIKSQLVEVLGQKKLLNWSIPGLAHAFVMYAFLILASVYLEAYGALFDPKFAIPLIGHWAIVGFAQDLIGVLCLVGLITFAIIRLKNSPAKLGRQSRFKGSHLGGAWLVLFMITNVLWTMFLFRAAASAAGNLPYKSGAFVSIGIGKLFDGMSHDTLELLEHVGLLLHIGVMLVFLILVLHSKHLHIFIAPLNIMFGRRPVALGEVKPLISTGKPVTLDDIDDLDEDAKLGVGSIEDFSWKGLLDMASCTECGRCQSQCPAWNTEKPLSPKMLIMNLRDHAFAAAPYNLAAEGARGGLSDEVKAEAARPLVGETEGEAWHPTGGGIIDPDVLWSCVTCGACVQQCPVDIEHVDHIVDMRRYQVLVESNFPAELNQLFKGMENNGNPWNMSPKARMDWAKDLPFDVQVVGEDLESLESVDWLFWVGCAGAYEDRAKKTTRAVAELLNMAGVSFGVLGNGETCTGDSARRAGNEFVFQGLAQQNIETFKEFKVKKVVSTCAHCFNTLKNEYKEFGIELEVVHHTQLLNRLVREGKLTPVRDGAGAAKRTITYHDPCYIGRHNKVYEPPRELLQVLPGAEFVEMERNSERSFCCGAGGARMWMEETIGSRINSNRTKEAVGTGADQIAVGCPFCRVMLADGLLEEQASGAAREEVEVLDVAQMLLASVKGEVATRTRPAAKAGAAAAGGEAAGAAGGTATATIEAPEEPAAPEAKSGGSLFDTPAPETPAAPAPTGGSLFDTPAPTPAPAEPAASGGSLFDTPAPEAPAAPASSSGSLFDVAPTEEPVAEKPSSGGSLFDIATPAEPEPEAAAPTVDLSTSSSLFDIAAPPEPEAAAPTEPETEDPETIFDEDEAAEDEAPEAAPAAESENSEPRTDVDINKPGSLFDL